MTANNKGRASLVTVITTPLGFFALSLLIVEGFLITILVGSGLSNTNALSPFEKFMGLMIGAGLFVFVISIVTVIVWKKPQNLTFSEHSHLEHDKMFGDQHTQLTEAQLESLPVVPAQPEDDSEAAIATP